MLYSSAPWIAYSALFSLLTALLILLLSLEDVSCVPVIYGWVLYACLLP